MWNAANGLLLAKLEGHTTVAFHAAFSPDGQRIVTASADKTARVWNAANGQLLAKLEGHTDSVVQAAFSPDGQRIVSASADKRSRKGQNGRLRSVLDVMELSRGGKKTCSQRLQKSQTCHCPRKSRSREQGI